MGAKIIRRLCTSFDPPNPAISWPYDSLRLRHFRSDISGQLIALRAVCYSVALPRISVPRSPLVTPHPYEIHPRSLQDLCLNGSTNHLLSMAGPNGRRFRDRLYNPVSPLLRSSVVSLSHPIPPRHANTTPLDLTQCLSSLRKPRPDLSSSTTPFQHHPSPSPPRSTLCSLLSSSSTPSTLATSFTIVSRLAPAVHQSLISEPLTQHNSQTEI